MNVKVIAGLLIVVLLILQYRLWFEHGGIRDMWRLKKQLASQRLENVQMKNLNLDLIQQVKYTRNNKQASEMRARDELGMVKKGETFYQIVEK